MIAGKTNFHLQLVPLGKRHLQIQYAEKNRWSVPPGPIFTSNRLPQRGQWP
jgi:hypothetical protein